MSATTLPEEICVAAARGELPKVVPWLHKGGHVDALCSKEEEGRSHSMGLLHAAAASGQLAVAKELLKRGATVDLPDGEGDTPLFLLLLLPPVDAANSGHHDVLLLLLEYSANPDLQDVDGTTALMLAAHEGHEAFANALLRANANTELRDKDGRTARQHAEAKGHTAIAELIRLRAAPPPQTAVITASSTAGEPAGAAERGELLQVVSPSGGRAEVEVPDEFLCPITSEIMVDPVTTVRETPPP
jgi:ankyrin repeat protein